VPRGGRARLRLRRRRRAGQTNRPDRLNRVPHLDLHLGPVRPRGRINRWWLLD